MVAGESWERALAATDSDEAQIASQLVERIHFLPPTLDYRELYIPDQVDAGPAQE